MNPCRSAWKGEKGDEEGEKSPQAAQGQPSCLGPELRAGMELREQSPGPRLLCQVPELKDGAELCCEAPVQTTRKPGWAPL